MKTIIIITVSKEEKITFLVPEEKKAYKNLLRRIFVHPKTTSLLSLYEGNNVKAQQVISIAHAYLRQEESLPHKIMPLDDLLKDFLEEKKTMLSFLEKTPQDTICIALSDKDSLNTLSKSIISLPYSTIKFNDCNPHVKFFFFNLKESLTPTTKMNIT